MIDKYGYYLKINLVSSLSEVIKLVWFFKSAGKLKCINLHLESLDLEELESFLAPNQYSNFQRCFPVGSSAPVACALFLSNAKEKKNISIFRKYIKLFKRMMIECKIFVKLRQKRWKTVVNCQNRWNVKRVVENTKKLQGTNELHFEMLIENCHFQNYSPEILAQFPLSCFVSAPVFWKITLDNENGQTPYKKIDW